MIPDNDLSWGNQYEVWLEFELSIGTTAGDLIACYIQTKITDLITEELSRVNWFAFRHTSLNFIGGSDCPHGIMILSSTGLRLSDCDHRRGGQGGRSPPQIGQKRLIHSGKMRQPWINVAINIRRIRLIIGLHGYYTLWVYLSFEKKTI